MKYPRQPTRGVLVEVPRECGPDVAWCWLLRRPNGTFAMQYRDHRGRMLAGSSTGNEGRPAGLYTDSRIRSKYPIQEAIARAKAIASRKAPATPIVDADPPAPPVLRAIPFDSSRGGPRGGLVRRLTRARKFKARYELLAMTEEQVVMPKLPPNQVPMSLPDAIAELDRRWQAAVAEAARERELRCLQLRWPDVGADVLLLL